MRPAILPSHGDQMVTELASQLRRSTPKPSVLGSCPFQASPSVRSQVASSIKQDANFPIEEPHAREPRALSLAA